MTVYMHVEKKGLLGKALFELEVSTVKNSAIQLGLRAACFASMFASCLLLGARTSNGSLLLTLGVGNSAIAGYAGPYGYVSVNRTDSTHATISFTSTTTGAYTFLFGAQGAIGVNVNGSYSISNVSASLYGNGTASDFLYLGPGPHAPGSGSEDGFGSFSLSFEGTDASHPFSDASFKLTNTSGTWATDADVLTPNNTDHLAAAHVLVYNAPIVIDANAVKTGYAADGTTGTGNGPPPPVPEPLSLAIWGLGLGICGVVGMRRRGLKQA